MERGLSDMQITQHHREFLEGLVGKEFQVRDGHGTFKVLMITHDGDLIGAKMYEGGLIFASKRNYNGKCTGRGDLDALIPEYIPPDPEYLWVNVYPNGGVSGSYRSKRSAYLDARKTCTGQRRINLSPGSDEEVDE